MDASLNNKRKNLGFLLVIITSLCYGTMPSVTQKCYELGLSIETTLTTRYILGTALIWIFIFAARRKKKVSSRELAFLLGLGVLAFICTWCMSASYQYIPGAIASILVFLYIIYVNVIEVIIGREKFYTVRAICLALVVAGVVLIIYTPGDFGSLNIKGLILAILAGVFYSGFSMAQGAKMFGNISAEVVMGYCLLVPTLILTLKCIIGGDPIFPEIPEQWMYVSLLAVGPQFLSPVCFCAAIKIIGASTASMINTSEPVIAYFAGILIMSDKITWNATMGGLVVVVAILVLNVTERKRGKHLSGHDSPVRI